MLEILAPIIVIFLICMVFWIIVTPPEDIKIIEKKCKKDPTKICPYQAYLTGRGGIRAEGHLKCCAVIDNIKKMHDAFSRMEPGVSYGEISITADFKRQAQKAKEKLDKIDTSKGPLQ